MNEGIGLEGDVLTAGEETPVSENAPVEPQFVTREEAQKMADAAAEKASRLAQSLVDKSASRLSDTVKRIEEAYAMTGEELTPEKRAAIRQKVAIDSLVEAPVVTPQVSQTPAQAQGTGDYGAIAVSLVKQMGTTLEDSDPEVRDIVYDTPEAFLLSVQKAATAKLKREASQASRSPTGGMPAGGLVQGTTPSLYDPKADPVDILSEAFSRKR